MLPEEKLLDLTKVEMPTTESLPTEDGVPLESPWHRAEINLLLESIDNHWQDRDDYYAGGNMFVYYSSQQVRNREYRGPDFFVVLHVDGTKDRGAWVVWEENGRYPDVIIELLSPSTAEFDKTGKKQLYEQTFRTPEYYAYDPTTQELMGWHLRASEYEEIPLDANGRLWSEKLQLWLGLAEGEYAARPGLWLRFFDKDGRLIPTVGEQEADRAEQEADRAEQATARAEQATARAEQEAEARRAAEAEVARLREELARLQDKEE